MIIYICSLEHHISIDNTFGHDEEGRGFDLRWVKLLYLWPKGDYGDRSRDIPVQREYLTVLRVMEMVLGTQWLRAKGTSPKAKCITLA